MAHRSRDSTVLTLASQKGGPGRSLLAIHLAVYAEAHGVRTVLVDGDPQETAAKWHDRRKSETPALVTASAGALHDVLDAARQGGYDLAVIDTPPHAAAQIDEAVRLSDFVVIPCRPTPNDLDAVGATVTIVEAHHVPAAFVLNSVPPQGTEAVEARGLLRDLYPKITVCPVTVGQRKAFYHALIDGRAVNEYAPESKASREIDKLWRWLRRTAWQDA